MIKKILIFLIPVLIVAIYGFKSHDDPHNNGNNGGPRNNSHPNTTQAVSSDTMYLNQIKTWFRTNGSFNRDPSTGNAGFEWPKGSGKHARYASGLWLGCVVGNDTLTSKAEYAYDYSPGYWDANGDPQTTDPDYKIYSIFAGNTTSEDYLNWPANQGAYLDSVGNPLNLGSQTMFYSYIDYPHASGSTSLASLKAQILQTNWVYNVNGALGSIIFQEYRVINKSTNVWTKTIMGQWTDDDLGDGTDDKVGCNVSLNLGFTYNATNSDGIYGGSPPAVGFDFFRGAAVFTGIPTDSVYYYSPPGTNNYIVKYGYKDLGMNVFNYYNNTNPNPSDPLTNVETYRVLEGKWRTNESWVNPITGDTTTKCYDGDPVTQTGWLQPGAKDRRFIECTGPFNMNPGDTQTITVAQIISRGNSNLNSVKSLTLADFLAQRIFDANFSVPASAPVVPTSVYTPGNGKIYLSWSDTAEKISIPNKLSHGTYMFQGYNIYQIRPGTSGGEAVDRVLMATYDVQDGITDILDSVQSEAYGAWVYYTVQKGYDNGISRYFIMDRDYVNNTSISNGTQYNVVVTAYYYDSLGGPLSAPKVNETPITSTNIKQVIPQTLTPGSIVPFGVGDTIPTNQRDLGTMPIVITPLELTSATYKTTYGGSTSNPTWSLTKTVNGSVSTIVANSTDFSGKMDTVKAVDGFLTIHKIQPDSGVVRDVSFPNIFDTSGQNFYRNQNGWSYSPAANLWLTGPDTTAVSQVGNGGNKQFDSRDMGICFPTANALNGVGSFRNTKTKIIANGTQFTTLNDSIMTGGPLRTVKIVFGVPSLAYRFVPNYTINQYYTPYVDMVQVPFSVYQNDDLDSSANAPRQLNVGFVDSTNNGIWDPDTSALGGSNYTYIFATTYSTTPLRNYIHKNPGLGSPNFGLGSMDVMYIWLPRVKAVNGVPLTWSTGDTLSIYPYIITRPNFVPGYPVSYSWTVDGTQIANHQTASSQVGLINVFPNPYYGGSSLETSPFNRFVYFSHLPMNCTIYIYTLDGVLVQLIQRHNTDPNNSLEQWNLQNSSNIPVASGMYIVYIDCGSLGTKQLKVAIFQPQERLDTF